MMATDDQQPGRASGYSVEEESDGGFRWSAFGPTGTRQGRAETRTEAEAAAQRAEQDLRPPPRSDA